MQTVSMEERKYTLRKAERLCSKKLIDALFSGGNKSLAAYPVRAVYMPVRRDGQPPVSVLMSVSKRHFKRAVKRNRVKRQLREAYRKNKHILFDALEATGGPEAPGLVVAFIWLSDDLFGTAAVEARMKNLLHRLAESLVQPAEEDKA